MRKAAALFFCLVLILSLAVSASAATGVSQGLITASVSSQGDCQITLDLTVHLEADGKELLFPVPGNAKAITVNGISAKASRSGDTIHVKLGTVLGNVTGDFPIRIQYIIPEVVTQGEEEQLLVTLPLLSGFNHPIEKLDFSISLPAAFPGRPNFISGYYTQTIESSINYTITEGTIAGTVDTVLKDRETLTMTLEVPQDMFPHMQAQQWSSDIWVTLMMGVGAVALVYWVLFLRCAPYLPRRNPQPPEGYTAGELPGLLTGHGLDLTAMVFSWAQMGYLLIQLTDTGRVILHKRMDMGNERDPREVKLFRSLFGKRRFVDGTGYQYAVLSRKAEGMNKGTRHHYLRSSGNPRLLRLLCALIGTLSGAAVGRALAGFSALGILAMILFAALGSVVSWLIQLWAEGLHLRHRRNLVLGLLLAVVWGCVGIAAGIPGITFCAAGVQLLCGPAALYGGRHSSIGRQMVSEMLGLRRYLKKLPSKQALSLLKRNPNFFFAMAPYALALGVLRPFAKHFKGKRLPGCPYLTTGMDGHMTAWEWCQIMEETAATLDARRDRLLLEKLLPR